MSIWRLMAHHDDPHAAIEEMKRRNRIAIGWTYTGDLRLSGPHNQSVISGMILNLDPQVDNAHLGGPSLWNLYQNMQVGDLVIVNAESKRICVFEVLGPYIFEAGPGQILGYGHQRPAVLTELSPQDLWTKSGSFAPGQNKRWTLAGCAESPTGKAAVYREGARFSVLSTAIERNPIARQKCIDHFGCKCLICGFDFRRTYGSIGEDYIHVHHRIELSSRDGEHDVDPIRDLVPLCPNCHAMIHRDGGAMPVEELKAIYSRNNA